MQVSHSRVEQFAHCKYKYQLRYIEKIRTIPSDDPQNALILGTSLHTGLEKGVTEAIKEYYMSYPVITDAHVNEAIKLEMVIPKAKELLPPGGEFEIELSNENFVGYLDYITPATVFERGVELPNQYDLYDFKYSNNVSNYMDSGQLHEYKYFFELLNPGKKIRNMYFLFVPKVNIKQKKTEDLMQFRRRLLQELVKVEPTLVKIDYNPNKVIDFMFGVKSLLEEKDYPKEPGWLCNYCEYQIYCMKGEDYMNLPSKERRNIEKVDKKVVWLYGSPFSGKTTFANNFPDPLMLNTDGNIKFVDAPYIGIKDIVEVKGRMTNKTFAWQVFKDTISELEKKDNEFKTIVVDLLEDTYEYCRLYMYDQMGITHESDDSFKAWDKVRTEFLSTLKRLMALDYNIILISHEDTSKDITKKGGDKTTSIKPNLNDKTANKVAGMVDIVARVVADDDKRVLSFKTNEVIFGGGRLVTQTNEINLGYDEFVGVYEEANKIAVAKLKGGQATEQNKTEKDDKPKGRGRGKKQEEIAVTEEEKTEISEDDVDTPPSLEETTEENSDEEVQEKSEPVEEEKPKARSRKRRTEDEQ